MKPTRFLVNVMVAALAAMTCGWSQPGIVFAQSSVPTVGVLTPGMSYGPVIEGMRDGLGKLGYKEGTNLRVMVEDSNGDIPALASRAATLVEAKSSVIFAVSTASAAAAKRATNATPIIFASVAEPVQAGLVASFASSRNKLTGVTTYASSLSGKRLEVLQEIAPKTRKVLIIVSANEETSRISAQHSEVAARKIGIQVVLREVASAEDLENLLAERWAGRVNAVFVVPSVLVGNSMERIANKAKNERLILNAHEETLVRKGALVSYGGDRRSFGVQAANLIAKVLKGSKPADIPIEVPDRLILAVNLTTAKAIGIKIPRSVLDRVDRLVE